MKNSKKNILLFFVFLIYSISVLFSKFASMQQTTFLFVMFYSISLVFLLIYAIGWQVVLKYSNLSIVYPLKVITLLFSMFFGIIFFEETISFGMMIGTVIIFIGVFLVGGTHE